MSTARASYVLEGKEEIDKGDFDAAEKLINDCRKDGRLSFMAEGST